MVAVIVIFWFVSSAPLHAKIAMSAIGGAASAMVSTLFVFLHCYERRLGPYMLVDREAIHLRHGRRIPLADYVCFEVNRRWESAGDSETLVSYLVLRSKGAEDIEILASAYYPEIDVLKRRLDKYMSRILIARPCSDGSAS